MFCFVFFFVVDINIFLKPKTPLDLKVLEVFPGKIIA